MLNRIFGTMAFSFLLIQGVLAQGTMYSLKGGLTIATQKWDGFQQDPLLKLHGALSAETYNLDEPFAMFAQIGYHPKGSALRNQNFFNPINGQIYRPPAQQFIFRNLSLVLGGKRKYDFGTRSKAYYLFGLRGDYTISTNLDEYNEINELSNSLFFPSDNFVRKLNFGVTLGGGLEVMLGDLIGASLEFTVNPDFSQQYRQPAIPNVYDPYTGMNRTLPERTIRNLTFEITAGFRFLRKIEYVD